MWPKATFVNYTYIHTHYMYYTKIQAVRYATYRDFNTYSP